MLFLILLTEIAWQPTRRLEPTCMGITLKASGLIIMVASQ